MMLALLLVPLSLSSASTWGNILSMLYNFSSFVYSDIVVNDYLKRPFMTA